MMAIKANEYVPGSAEFNDAIDCVIYSYLYCKECGAIEGVEVIPEECKDRGTHADVRVDCTWCGNSWIVKQEYKK